jgi:sugar lactone lactonase YvrE
VKDLFRLAGIIISITAMLASCGGSDSTSSSGATVTTFAGTAGSQGSADGTGTAALFHSPSAITTDGTNLYVTDSGNNTIRKIVIATGAVAIFSGSANGDSGSTDGIGTTALFNRPSGITTDGTNLYVTDSGNNMIRKIVIATGEVTTLAGTAGSSGSADGTGTAALFNNPLGVASDVNDVYVADSGNHMIRKIAIATGEVTTLAGTAETSGAADGTGTAALFNNPADIASDGTNLYVADSGNNTIRKIVIATREVTTLAGTAGTSGSADGTGTAALFNNPLGIATDRTNLYIADSGNNTIRKIVIAKGTVTTFAGKTGSSGSANGNGTAALFNNPVGVATVGADLYVGDTGNNTIRKIT